MREKQFSVNYWGSHPDADNDDCYTGEDFDSKEEAIAFFKCEVQDPPNMPGYYHSCVAFIEIDGLEDSELQEAGIERVRPNPHHKPEPKSPDSGSWQREIAMQAGMEMGIHAYNDAMGFDSEEP